MGKRQLRRLAWLLGAVALVAGCENEDTERLGRAGRCIATRFEALTGAANGKLLTGWQAISTDLDQMSLETRVTARLRWDKELDGAAIEAHATDGVIELTGKVRDLPQRRRAVQLAESTRGTDKVTDSLEVAGE
jgi:osmotically-inducible protein OsmY